MSILRSLTAALRRRSMPRPGEPKGYTYHYEKLQDRLGRRGLRSADPSQDILLVADLRPTDRVLDMGCAEGHIALDVAKRVAHVDGVEIDPVRVKEAQRLAAERGTRNVSFAAGSVFDYPLEPQSYDLTLFLGVLNKEDGSKRVGLAELERLLVATQRQIVIRFGIEKASAGISLLSILDTLNGAGFDGICFFRRKGAKAFFGNLIVGNRRGTDARLIKVPPLALVPTKNMREHPCIRNAEIGRYDEFS